MQNIVSLVSFIIISTLPFCPAETKPKSFFVKALLSDSNVLNEDVIDSSGEVDISNAEPVTEPTTGFDISFTFVGGGGKKQFIL